METHDAELIQRTLAGDQTAFTALVEKYYKGIHALTWRKIGDFHIAEEITQDAFLRAYEQLKTLKTKSGSEPTNQQQSTNVKYQFYIGDYHGIRLSTDDGNSWKRFNTGLGGKIQNLTVFNNRLYAVADDQLITSTDGGQSWDAIPLELGDMNMMFNDKKVPLSPLSKVRQITDADGILYAKGDIGLQPQFFRLDEENRTLIPIQGVPTLGERNPITAFMKMVQTSMADDGKNANSNFPAKFLSLGADILGTFAFSGNTFYVEYRRKLLIWHSSSNLRTRNPIL